MKKTIVLIVTILLLAASSVSSLAASRVYKSATITMMDEEIDANGVMTGRKIPVGTTTRAVASYMYDRPNLYNYVEVPFGKTSSITNTGFSNGYITFKLNATYKACVYVYMGGFSPMESPVANASWPCSVRE